MKCWAEYCTQSYHHKLTGYPLILNAPTHPILPETALENVENEQYTRRAAIQFGRWLYGPYQSPNSRLEDEAVDQHNQLQFSNVLIASCCQIERTMGMYTLGEAFGRK